MNNTVLYTLDTKGKTRYWKAYSDLQSDRNGWITIKIEYGVKDSAKFITKERHVKSGKNIGKSNETSVQQQAELEIGYLYQKQFP